MHCPHCGAEFDTKRRSVPDHRRLFALVHAAFQQWPEAHDFQPNNSEELRAWLVCKAGPEYRTSTRVLLGEIGGDADMLRHAIEVAIRAAGGKAFVVPDKFGVAIISPKSMSFSRMKQSEFSKLRDAITDLIEMHVGCKVEDLAKEAA